MKPYKIIKSKNPCLKRKTLVGNLKETKIPFWLFKNVHPPRRVEFYFEFNKIHSSGEGIEDVKYEIGPSGF